LQRVVPGRAESRPSTRAEDPFRASTRAEDHLSAGLDDYMYRGGQVAGASLAHVPAIAYFEAVDKQMRPRQASSAQPKFPGRARSLWTEFEDKALKDAVEARIPAGTAPEDVKLSKTAWKEVAVKVRAVTDDERGGADQPGRTGPACKTHWPIPVKADASTLFDKGHPLFDTHWMHASKGAPRVIALTPHWKYPRLPEAFFDCVLVVLRAHQALVTSLQAALGLELDVEWERLLRSTGPRRTRRGRRKKTGPVPLPVPDHLPSEADALVVLEEFASWATTFAVAWGGPLRGPGPGEEEEPDVSYVATWEAERVVGWTKRPALCPTEDAVLRFCAWLTGLRGTCKWLWERDHGKQKVTIAPRERRRDRWTKVSPEIGTKKSCRDRRGSTNLAASPRLEDRGTRPPQVFPSNSLWRTSESTPPC